MSGWEDPPTENETSWGLPDSFNNAAIVTEVPAQEFAAMNIDAGTDGEKRERPLRRFREYGIIPPISPALAYNIIFQIGVSVIHDYLI